MSNDVPTTLPHSEAWIAQTWFSFGVASIAMSVGIYHLPTGSWERGYMAMASLLLVASTLNLSKTVRDLHEAKRIASRVENARVEKILSDHDPLAI